MTSVKVRIAMVVKWLHEFLRGYPEWESGIGARTTAELPIPEPVEVAGSVEAASK